MVSADISSIKIQACGKYFSKVVHRQHNKMSWCENPVKFIFKLFFVLLILCSNNWHTIGPFNIIYVPEDSKCSNKSPYYSVFRSSDPLETGGMVIVIKT